MTTSSSEVRPGSAAPPARRRASAAESPERIYVRTPNWLGDVVMATPALRALRTSHPRARITLAGPPWLPDLLGGLDWLDRICGDVSRSPRAVLERASFLRREHFDWAILLPDSVAVALAPFLARVPLRAGYARDPLRRALLSRSLRAPSEKGRRAPISMIERYLRVTRAVGCPDTGNRLEICVWPEAREAVGKRLEDAGFRPEIPFAAITPGASFGSSKLWPVAHFAKACDGLSSELGLRTVLAPGPGEEGIAREVVCLMRTPALSLDDPPTRIPELVALIERAKLLVTNDTGPRHIAVALGRPVVTLMGPTDPRHTHHLLERQRVLREDVECSPCHLKVCPIDHRCLVRLAPERVIAAAGELLE